MPRVDFRELPDAARVWVFACDRPLQGNEAEVLLEDVDAYLDRWQAHGKPLRDARDWRDDRFLAIGIDPTAEQASGCSIDGLFRELRSIEQRLATTMLQGGRIYYRDAKGRAQLALRNEVPALQRAGVLTPETPIFDTTVTDVGAWRERFVRPARDTWVASLLGDSQASQRSSRSATNASSVRNG